MVLTALGIAAELFALVLEGLCRLDVHHLGEPRVWRKFEDTPAGRRLRRRHALYRARVGIALLGGVLILVGVLLVP